MDDYNFDARQEIRLANDQLVCLISPGDGGQMYELDVRSICHNLLATMARAVASGGVDGGGGDCSMHATSASPRAPVADTLLSLLALALPLSAAAAAAAAPSAASTAPLSVAASLAAHWPTMVPATIQTARSRTLMVWKTSNRPFLWTSNSNI